MITLEQKERRKKGLFASDIARVMTGDGVRVALEKMGEIEPDNLDGVTSVELGNILEKPVLDAYVATQSPDVLIRSPDTIYHPDYDWLGCHLDGLARFPNSKRVVEAKAFSAFNREGWGDPGTDEVPLPRMWQCMAQIAITGASQADIPICFVNEKALAQFLTSGTVPIETYIIPRNEDLIAYMIDEAKKLWNKVSAGELPDPVNPGDADIIYRRASAGKIVDAPENLVELHHALRDVRKRLKEVEDSKLLIESQIKSYMQDAAELRYHGKALVTWKNNKDGEDFDKDAFKKTNPDLYQQFCSKKPGARPFLLKE